MTKVLGFDIGGSSVKSAIVDVDRGNLVSETSSIDLQGAVKPERLLSALVEHASQLGWTGPVGVGYPGVIVDGVVRTAAHLDHSFIGLNLFGKLNEVFNRAALINDADAAGLAEMAFGAGRDHNHESGGTVMMLTLGTGIGSALFTGGRLFPNTEFGHMYVGELEAEEQAAASVKTRKELDYHEWSDRLNRVLCEYYRLLSPDLIIMGGGISENFESFRNYLDVNCEIRPATLANNAGVIGAALAVTRYSKK